MWLLGKVLGMAARARALSANPVTDVALPTDRSVGRLPHEPYFLTAQQIEDAAVQLDTCPPYGCWCGSPRGRVSAPAKLPG